MTATSPPGRWVFRWFCLCLALLSPSLSLAERLPLRSYTTTDGLAHNEINKIVRDSRGFLWFCTGEGLSRFDGYSFTNFGIAQGLPNANVTDLLETRGGEYWVGTNGGLVRFNPKGTPSGQVIKLDDPNAMASMFSVVASEDQDRRANSVTVLLEDRNGTIWFGTSRGLFQLTRRDNRLAPVPINIGIPKGYLIQQTITDVLEDGSGTLWIATLDGLYRRSVDGSARRYTRQDGLPSNFLQDLLEDHDGRLWVATRTGGFFQFSTADAHQAVVAQVYGERDGLNSNWAFQLFETASHRFWIATNNGLVEFFPEGEPDHRFSVFTSRNGLSFHEVTALNEDLGGNLWLGTNTAGAMKLARKGFITYDQSDALVQVSAIFADRKGDVCFKGNVLGNEQTSVFEGAALNLLDPLKPTQHQRFGCFDGQRFDWFKPKAIEDLGWVMEQVTLQTRNGEWWIAGGQALYRFGAADSLLQIKSAAPINIYSSRDGVGPQVFRLFEDRNGDVWISGFAGIAYELARWERANETWHDVANSPGLPSPKENLVGSFGEDRHGNVWMGFSGAIARHAHGSFKLFTAADGVPPGAITNIFLDHAGRLWLASARSGLIRIDDPGAARPAFINYTTAQGLSSNATEVITEDLNGYIYAGGGNGLDRLDPLTGRIKHFTTADGLASGLFRDAFRDRNGVLWFGMTQGLSRFTPTPDEQSAPPSILITGVKVAGATRLVSALGETQMSLAELSPNENQLQMDFVGLNFVPGEVLRYQHKLEGADHDWSSPNELRVVNYANLAPGRYRFLVRTINSNDDVSAIPAALTFTILRPLWQRWWFLTFAAGILCIMVYLIYRYRLTRLLEMANMRTRIATDLHDDIGANLTRITILSEVAKQQFANGKESNGHPLSSIADIARESVSSMSDIVWAINPQRDSLRDLIRKMRQHADEIFTLREIDLDFQAPSSEVHLKLGADLRRNLLLLFKETVNNAARHSKCSQVRIDFRVEGSSLNLSVEDNGRGFDPSLINEGHGLVSMRRRAEELGATFEVVSAIGSGTMVRVRIPAATVRARR